MVPETKKAHRLIPSRHRERLWAEIHDGKPFNGVAPVYCANKFTEKIRLCGKLWGHLCRFLIRSLSSPEYRSMHFSTRFKVMLGHRLVNSLTKAKKKIVHQNLFRVETRDRLKAETLLSVQWRHDDSSTPWDKRFPTLSFPQSNRRIPTEASRALNYNLLSVP